jgi:hypothetical protein
MLSKIKFCDMNYKFYIAILSMLLSVLPVLGQENELESRHRKSAVGFRTGFNLSRWIGEGAGYARVKTGYHAGFFMKCKINDKYLFQPEVLFSLRGHTSAFETGFGEIVQRQTLYCIDLPLLFGIVVTEGLYFNLGLQPSYLVAAKFRRDYPDGTTFIGNSTEGFRKFGLDILTGLELQISPQFSFGSRLGYGLTSVSTNKDSGLHNLFLQLTVGYSF